MGQEAYLQLLVNVKIVFQVLFSDGGLSVGEQVVNADQFGQKHGSKHTSSHHWDSEAERWIGKETSDFSAI